MYYKVEFDIHNFEFWSGAYDRTKDLDYDQLEKLGQHIEMHLGDSKEPTDTQINDFVWFECDDFLEELENKAEDLEENLKIKKIKKEKKKSQNKRKIDEVKLIVDLSKYQPWSGAVDTWTKIVNAGAVEDFDSYLEELYPDGLTATDLNDILWFDGSRILIDLGILEELSTDDFESYLDNNANELSFDIYGFGVEKYDNDIEINVTPSKSLSKEDEEKLESEIEKLVDEYLSDYADMDYNYSIFIQEGADED